ncbi:MAG: ABC transporter permease [Bacteroidota bacterium]
MLINYFKIAIRALFKQRIYAAINMLGLSIGIASCFLILLHVEDEYSYDRFHDNAENIYRVTLERKYPTHGTFYAPIPHSFADVMVRDFPEVLGATRILVGNNNGTVVTYQDETRNEIITYEEDNFHLVDSSFFKLFNFKMLKGNPETALIEPNSVVITASTAKKYFGDKDPLNQTINSDFGEFRVTGVCEDVPENSHLEFDLLGSWVTFPFARTINYMGFSTHTYVVLDQNASSGDLEAKFPDMVEKYAAPQIEERLGLSFEEYQAAGNGYRYFLQPLLGLHLDPTNVEAKLKPGGNKTVVYIFISIAALILLIACINFMNLATARSAERAKEVGVRKSMGSMKNQLVTQFLVESVVLSVISTVIALGLIYLALPYFNTLAGKQLSISLTSGFLAPGMLIFAVFVGVLAGSYPAFIISSFNTIMVMKGNLRSSRKGAWLRNGLVIFQFMISIVLIVGSLVVQDQMNYVQNKSLGFDKEHVLTIERAFTLNEQLDAFMKELRRQPEIINVGGSASKPGGFFFGMQFQSKGSTEILTVKGMSMDDHYAPTIGFELLEGRWFGEAFEDSLAAVLNEKAAEVMGIDDPVGAKILHTDPNQVVREYTVVGIVQDFHFQSLRDDITPLVLLSTEGAAQNTAFVSARIKPGGIQDAITFIESKWNELVPDQPLKYSFLDQDLDDQYQSVQSESKVLRTFAALAIIIACVGLFGLAAYTAGQRTKEIGVRKVLGASVLRIVTMLSADFTKLIAIAFIIATPLSWWLMQQWLGGFAYRIKISPMTFLIAGFSSLLIAWLTVSYQSIKAAIVNPVKSLRSE